MIKHFLVSINIGNLHFCQFTSLWLLTIFLFENRLISTSTNPRASGRYPKKMKPPGSLKPMRRTQLRSDWILPKLTLKSWSARLGKVPKRDAPKKLSTFFVSFFFNFYIIVLVSMIVFVTHSSKFTLNFVQLDRSAKLISRKSPARRCRRSPRRTRGLKSPLTSSPRSSWLLCASKSIFFVQNSYRNEFMRSVLRICFEHCFVARGIF